MKNRIYLADNMEVLPTIADRSVDLIYIDPPFNTGKVQQRTRMKTVQITDDEGPLKRFEHTWQQYYGLESKG